MLRACFVLHVRSGSVLFSYEMPKVILGYGQGQSWDGLEGETQARQRQLV